VGNLSVDKAERGSTRKTVLYIGLVALILSALALAVYVVPALIGLGLIAATVTFFVCEIVLRDPKGIRSIGIRSVATAYAVIAASFAVNAVVVPRPLPLAHIKLTGGTAIAGQLVTSANGRWSLARSHDEIAVIPEAEVVSVLIHSHRPVKLHRDMSRAFGVAWWIPPSALLLALIGLGANWWYFVRKRNVHAKAGNVVRN
jgi:hypothetical protein